MTGPFHGHMTKTDGTHVELSADEAEKLWKDIEEQDAKRAANMPNFKAAINAISNARQRLRDLGWSEGIYCPQDGTPFAVVTPGSTGIHQGRYRGKYPDGRIDMGDESARPEGCMWKAIDKLSDDERELMEHCAADHREWMERQFKMFAAMDRAEK